MSLIIKIASIIISIAVTFFFGKSKGKVEEQKRQLKNENENLQENIRINKETSSMDFDDRCDFLLSKQENNNK